MLVLTLHTDTSFAAVIAAASHLLPVFSCALHFQDNCHWGIICNAACMLFITLVVSV